MAINDDTLNLARKLRIDIAAITSGTARALVAAWAEAWNNIHDEWAEAMMDVAQLMHDGDGPVPPSMILHRDRAQVALTVATEQIHALTDYTGITVYDALGRAVATAEELELAIIGSQFPASSTLRTSLLRVDRHALTSIVERVMEQVHSDLYPLSGSAITAMRQALVQGVAMGNHPSVTASRMLRNVEGAFNGGLTRALTIARTETLDAYRAAAHEVEFINRDVLAGWMWQAELTTDTCPSCWAMHGTLFPVTEPGPHDHQNGRCARTPRVKPWAELGFTGIDEPPDLFPDAQAAFDALSTDDQLKILGPGRYEAYQKGVPLTDMAVLRPGNGQWRPSYVPTPVRDVLDRAALL